MSLVRLGDKIAFITRSGKVRFTQTVTSMEIDHRQITEAGPGADVGILIVPPHTDDKFPERVHKGDIVILMERTSRLSTGMGELHFFGLKPSVEGGKVIKVEKKK